MELVLNDHRLKKGVILNYRYKIYAALAASELSIVYLARDTRLKRTVVVKEFYPNQLVLRDLDQRSVVCRKPSLRKTFDEWLLRFRSEIDILREMDHPHIVSYAAHFNENGTGYLVTEYCRGSALHHYRSQVDGQLEASFFKQMMLPLVDALQYIHSKGYIHRDIKPGNIIIGKKGKPWLIDFGSAVSFTRSEKRQVVTTAGFSALELYSETSRLGPWSDMYSLSAVLYYYISGTMPPDVSERLIEDEIIPLRELKTNVSSMLAQTIMKGLSVEPQKRVSLKTLKAALQYEAFRLKRLEKKLGAHQTRLAETSNGLTEKV
ncbi:serine/threonine protein kinase [Marinicrinis lubricantis]|uniref:Serine/threonine protein kinase n=1 Tax=Marinicrinis lubricantis TaxID=2086470 RepID=A0ABW1IND6_9BACL